MRYDNDKDPNMGIWWHICDFFDLWGFPLFMLAVIVGMSFFAVFLSHAMDRKHKAAELAKAEFFIGCLQDHKEYECTILWRQGNSNSSPSFIPIPIVIPMGGR